MGGLTFQMTNPLKCLRDTIFLGLGWTPACVSNKERGFRGISRGAGHPTPSPGGWVLSAGRMQNISDAFSHEIPLTGFKNGAPGGQVICPRSQPRTRVGPRRGNVIQTPCPLGHRQKLCEATSQESEPVAASFPGSSEYIPDRNRSRADSTPGAKLTP